jgi:hypothetical protein
MVKQKEKPKRNKRSALRVIAHYIFLWPSFRTYYTMLIGHFKKGKKPKKKEKVVIIED